MNFFSVVSCCAFIFLNASGHFSLAQNLPTGQAGAKIDSLLALLGTTTEDSVRVNTLNSLSAHYVFNNVEKSKDYAWQAIELAEKLGSKRELSYAYSNMGKALNTSGEYKEALEYQLKSLSLKEELDDKRGMAAIYINIGNVHANQDNHKLSLDYFEKSLNVSRSINDIKGEATALHNMGNVYVQTKKYAQALDAYRKAALMEDQVGDKRGLAMTYNNIAVVLKETAQPDSALAYYLLSLNIKEQIGDKQGIMACYTNIGCLHKETGKLTLAMSYLRNAEKLGKEIGARRPLKETYLNLAETFEKMKDFEQAFIYYRMYTGLKDSLVNAQSQKEIAQIQGLYDTEKKDKEILQMKKDKELSDAELHYQRVMVYLAMGALAVVLVLLYFIFRENRQKHRANIEITAQKQIIEEKQKQVLDSIHYAKRIQRSILPSEKYILRNLKRLRRTGE